MKNLQNLEIINISTKEGKLIALLSFQDTSKIGEDLNNGYGTIEIPINPREIQFSIHGNMLIDQSVKNYGNISARAKIKEAYAELKERESIESNKIKL